MALAQELEPELALEAPLELDLALEAPLELPAPAAELQQPILRAFSSRGFLFSC